MHESTRVHVSNIGSIDSELILLSLLPSFKNLLPYIFSSLFRLLFPSYRRVNTFGIRLVYTERRVIWWRQISLNGSARVSCCSLLRSAWLRRREETWSTRTSDAIGLDTTSHLTNASVQSAFLYSSVFSLRFRHHHHLFCSPPIINVAATIYREMERDTVISCAFGVNEFLAIRASCSQR